MDRELYLPQVWAEEAAGGGWGAGEFGFRTKPQLAQLC